MKKFQELRRRTSDGDKSERRKNLSSKEIYLLTLDGHYFYFKWHKNVTNTDAEEYVKHLPSMVKMPKSTFEVNENKAIKHK